MKSTILNEFPHGIAVESSTLYYVHDPMCSWCWGYRPVHDELKAQLPSSVIWKYLLGGLAPDSDVPMPEETRTMVRNHWRNIQAQLGTEFNFDFWKNNQPKRSTYPACRAVLAAARQNAENSMIDAIQRAYYLRAMNPSNDDTLLSLAGELGLDEDRFAQDLTDPKTHLALLREIKLARTMGVTTFPSLLLLLGNQRVQIPHDYHSPEPTLAAISTALQAVNS